MSLAALNGNARCFLLTSGDILWVRTEVVAELKMNADLVGVLLMGGRIMKENIIYAGQFQKMHP